MRSRPLAAEVLHAGDVAVPQRHAAYGAHAQLRDRRRGGASEADAWLQRAAPDGLGRFWAARRKCRDQEPYAPAGVEEQQHRRISAHAEAVWVQLRLAARNIHLRAGILPLEPVVLPADAGEGAGVPEKGAGELVPQVLHRAG